MIVEKPQEPGEVTRLLLKWRSGDEDALGQLMPLVHDELRRMARQFLRRERAGHTMRTTTLVNEAYLRLVGADPVDWRDRAHFFAIATEAMRRVLVDEARKRHRQKRGGEWTRLSLDEAMVVSREREVDLLALDEALEWLAERAPRKCRVVVLRFFGGLTTEETAAALCVSVDTVKTDWSTAKLWLMRRLSGKETDDGSTAVRGD
jgi:RNA polymerase sigma-70 factor, ECF subfamily